MSRADGARWWTRGGALVAGAALVVVVAMIAIGASRIVGGGIPPGPLDASPSNTVSAGPGVPSKWASLVDVALVDVGSGVADPVWDHGEPIVDGREFEVSPDGDAVAYLARGASDARDQIFVADIGPGRIDVTDPRQLTTDGALSAPRWSPDGNRLVYVDGTGDLSVLDVEDGSSRVVFEIVGDIWYPSFGPDGDSVVYTLSTGTSIGLWTVPVDGGRPRRVVRNAAAGAFSPDGSRIAFHAVSWWRSPYCKVDCFRFGRLTVISTGESFVPTDGGPPGPPSASWPPGEPSGLRFRWSPDGERIALLASGNFPRELVIVDVASMERASKRIGIGSGVTWFDDRTLLVTDYRGW